MSDVENPTLRAALEYAARGWRVLPLHWPQGGGCSCRKPGCSHTGKHPRTRHGVRDATTDAVVIESWWAEWPEANVGIAAGEASGLVVLDVDPRHGGDESLAELEERHGRLPETVEALTGGGGRHVLFASPEGGVRSRVGIAPGLDIRGEGTVFVASPSRHASGRTYEWELSSLPGALPLAAMPAWLVELAGAPSRNGDRPEPSGSSPIPEGARNATLASLAGSMRRRGMTEGAICAALQAENEARCCPPLDPGEVDRIASSISAYEPDPGATSLTPRPEILVTGRQDRELLDEARGALHQANRSLIYRAPGRLMRVQGSELHAVTAGGLHDTLARAASWVRATKDGLRSTRVPHHLLDPLLHAPGPPIPTVRHVIRVPAFVGEDFRLVTRPGLDGDTLYVGDPIEGLHIPEEPTPEDLEAAYGTLTAWLDEFSFTDDVSRSQAWALPLTLLVRPALRGRIPMFGVEASTAGTGKTTLAEVACAAVHGEPPVSTTWTKDGEEMGKRAASWILASHAVVLLDDLARITGEPAHVLSSLITTGAIQVRAMRELATAGGRWGGILVYTGNNVHLAEEMPRKICRIRLLSPEEPWARTFRRPDIHAWTLEHRVQILSAIGVLVAAWKAIGRPPGTRTRPSFHDWSRVIGGILGCASHEFKTAFLDPRDVADMMTFGEGVDDLRGFVEAWLGDAAARRAAKASELVAIAERAGVLEGILRDGNERSRASRLGRYLPSQRDKVINGHRIVGVTDARAKTMRWSLRPVSDEGTTP